MILPLSITRITSALTIVDRRVLQDTWIFKGSVRDNIAYGKPDATDAEVKALNDIAFVHYENYVGVDDCGQAVRHDEARFLFAVRGAQKLVERALHARPRRSRLCPRIDTRP